MKKWKVMVVCALVAAMYFTGINAYAIGYKTSIKKRIPVQKQKVKKENFVTLIEALKTNGKTRDLAEQALISMGPPAVPALIGVLKDKNNQVQVDVISMLGRICSKRAIDRLTEKLNSNNKNDREFAKSKLENIDQLTLQAVSVLINGLNDKDSSVRINAIIALGEIGPKAISAVPALKKILKIKHSYMWKYRAKAAYALGKIGSNNEKIAQILIKALDDEDRNCIAHSHNSKYSGKSEYTSYAYVRVRMHMIHGLGKIGPKAESAVPKLRILLKNPDARIRSSAAQALGEIGPKAAPAVIDLLLKALNDKNSYVQKRAAEALGRIGPKAKIADFVLIALLENKYIEIRLAAAIALGKIEPEAKEAVPALNKALNDKCSDVRRAAKKALNRIQKK